VKSAEVEGEPVKEAEEPNLMEPVLDSKLVMMEHHVAAPQLSEKTK
jgi:hypothetical protein